MIFIINKKTLQDVLLQGFYMIRESFGYSCVLFSLKKE